MRLALHDGGIFVWLDDQPFRGPIDTVLARRTLNLELPDQRGTLQVQLEFDDSFVAKMHGQPLLKAGEKAKKDRVRTDTAIRQASRSLLITGLLSVLLLAGLLWARSAHPDLVESIPPIALAWTGLESVALLGLGIWAGMDDRTAARPLAIAGSIFMVDAFVMLAIGNVPFFIGKGMTAMRLMGAGMMGSAAKSRHMEKQAMQRG